MKILRIRGHFLSVNMFSGLRSSFQDNIKLENVYLESEHGKKTSKENINLVQDLGCEDQQSSLYNKNEEAQLCSFGVESSRSKYSGSSSSKE